MVGDFGVDIDAEKASCSAVALRRIGVVHRMSAVQTLVIRRCTQVWTRADCRPWELHIFQLLPVFRTDLLAAMEISNLTEGIGHPRMSSICVEDMN